MNILLTLKQTFHLFYIAFPYFTGAIVISLPFKFARDFYISLFYCLKHIADPFADFFGMVGVIGYYGQGKSLTTTQMALNYSDLAKKHKKELLIYTNYDLAIQTDKLECLDDIERFFNDKIENNPDAYILFVIDELQNCLSSRQWGETAKMQSLLPIFTQTRKGKCMFLYTSPKLSQSDKNIRISSKYLLLTKKINRYFFIQYKINPDDLEGGKEVKLSLFPDSHVLLGKRLKNAYDSFKFIKTLQRLDYKTLEEVNGSSTTNVVNIKNKK